MADLCVDEYTDHGHCGVLDAPGDVDNDLTLEVYAKAALAQATAGAHVVAPSGMMDGQVGAIRAALDGGGFSGHPDPRLLGQVRERAVRPVPRRRRRADRRWRRPQGLPAGLAQRPRGADRDRGRHRPGRRHGDGQAGAELPRRHRRRPRDGRRADRRLPRQRRVRDGQGRGRQRLDRPRHRGARAAHRRSSGPAPTSSSRTSAAGSPRRSDADQPGAVRAVVRGHPRRRELVHPGVQVGRRHARTSSSAPRARTCTTSRATATSISCRATAR